MFIFKPQELIQAERNVLIICFLQTLLFQQRSRKRKKEGSSLGGQKHKQNEKHKNEDVFLIYTKCLQNVVKLNCHKYVLFLKNFNDEISPDYGILLSSF